jgi:phosphoglycolate phosphatase-like HAD superfamily hydrolase
VTPPPARRETAFVFDLDGTLVDSVYQLFLTAAARLGVDIETTSVVGDSVWDMLAARRARALGIGVLSGGYGQEELERAGAYRVYEDPADLLRHLDEVGGRR